MRELTLIETAFLGGGLLLSLVLPMLLSACAPDDLTARRSCLWIVLTGHVMLAIAGLVLLFSAAAAGYAIVIGSLGWLGCAVGLRHRISKESRRKSP
jgi:Flp pilus assembly protein protease CpaA